VSLGFGSYSVLGYVRVRVMCQKTTTTTTTTPTTTTKTTTPTTLKIFLKYF